MNRAHLLSRTAVFGVVASALLLVLSLGCASQEKLEPGVGRRGEPRKAGWGLVGDVVNEGLVDCFEAGATLAGETEPATCEASAVAYTGDHLVIASDKLMPGDERSSVFTVGITASEGRLGLEPAPRQHFTVPTLAAARKAEDLAVAPEGDLVFLTTAFDRLKDDDAAWNAYNTLLAWPPGKPEAAIVVNASEQDGVTSSLELRAALQRALRTEAFPEGPPYLKIEGLAALPGRKLWFGVREQGSSYQTFDFSIDIIEASYTVEGGVPRVDPSSFQLVYSAAPTLVLGHRVGLSSLEWDGDRERIYILTSFEHEPTDTAVGGFLFALNLKDLAKGAEPTLLRHRETGEPFMFGHKPEGVAVLNELHIVIVHDDDRVTRQIDVGDPSLSFTRAPHQAAYTMIKLKP